MNIELLELAPARLGKFSTEVVSAGGATLQLWISDPAAPEFRPTDDIDVIVDVGGREAYRAAPGDEA